MRIDRDKIIKSGLILIALFAIIGGLTTLRRHNSFTLSEYASEHSNSSEEAQDNISSETLQSEDAQESETENLQNENDSPFFSSLTGASLNGDSVKELRVSYSDSFYYEPLSENLRRYITGVSYPSSVITYPSDSHDLSLDSTEKQEDEDDAFSTQADGKFEISYDELRYVHILHYDFDGNLAEGELICNKAIAQDLVEIFYELYVSEYQLEQVLLIDEYDGDDTASMEANNTSCFNYRSVQDSASLSKHALGLAIDINPLYNPYITYEKDGSEKVSPASASAYADRTASFPYKIDENDLCYKLFKSHGFTWGGDWNSCKDYQHFQKVL